MLRGFRPLGSSRLPPRLTAHRLRWERSHCVPRPICAHKEKTNSSKARYYPDLNLRSRGKAPRLRSGRGEGAEAGTGRAGAPRPLPAKRVRSAAPLPPPGALRAPSFLIQVVQQASPRPPAIPTTARPRSPRCSLLVSTRTLSLVPPLGCSRASRRPSAGGLRGSCCDCRSAHFPAVNT